MYKVVGVSRFNNSFRYLLLSFHQPFPSLALYFIFIPWISNLEMFSPSPISPHLQPLSWPGFKIPRFFAPIPENGGYLPKSHRTPMLSQYVPHLNVHVL